ncbi:MAG: rhodanese-like domain-containing protein [Burkholderiaceae bacterium]|nr:rhodanese-like domain-containing protein [Burkholderiaceae bacterium]
MTSQRSFRNPGALCNTAALAARLEDPGLRIFDCTTWLIADSDDDPYRVANALPEYRQAHVPGSAYLDLQAELSDSGSRFRFTLPEPKALAAAFGRHGIGDDAEVVLYSRNSLQWAARIWWMLRAIGFDRAAILDGGWEKWEREGRPVRGGDERYPAAGLRARPRPELFVDSEAVLAAIGDSGTRIIDALSPQSHAGQSRRYGRPGRIAGSVNVPAASLRDPDTLELLSPDAAAAAFAAAGVDADTPAIVYCGGGIAASMDAFMLHQLGNDRVAVYDNSLNEWASDPAFPMERD